MTKKEFRERCSYHLYGKQNESGTKALFFDWQVTDNGTGFKYCIYGRAVNTNKKQLEDAMYNLVFNDQDTDWWLNCAIAQNDKQRFKVPIVSSGLTKLVKYELV